MSRKPSSSSPPRSARSSSPVSPLALARPSSIVESDRIATLVLVDVSESLSDSQLEAARGLAREIESARRPDDLVRIVTFAERPRALTSEPGRAAEAIARHLGEGRGTNLQAALQLAYGLLPEGYLPRAILLSDGNQTRGDLVAEAARAAEMGIPLSFASFAEGRREEVRIAALTLPEDIKVGAPFAARVEVWSSHAQNALLRFKQDGLPNPHEPKKSVSLAAGKNSITFRAVAKRAGQTTLEAQLSGAAHDTEPTNNRSAMSAPVSGRPRVLYVEGSAESVPSSASYLRRALEHENIDVEVRGPRGLPGSAKSLQPFDLVLVSDVPSHLMGLTQMAALEDYVRNLGGGLILAGGEDSFGSGGYQGTRIEKIMPVRFDGEKIREKPDIAILLVVDRSGSMAGAKLEAAKESARATAEVLSSSDLIGVIAFDQSPTTIVPVSSGRPTDTASAATSAVSPPAAAPTSAPPFARPTKFSSAPPPK